MKCDEDLKEEKKIIHLVQGQSEIRNRLKKG